MKKTFILITSLLLLLVSCKNPVFLPNPNPVKPNNDKVAEDSTLHAPRDVVAKHGMKGNIEISWKPVEDAVRYNIYRADNLFSDFVQVNEVKGNTTVYKQKKHAGFDKYYKISAVDITGKESEKSNVIRVTTLAQPIINDISGQQYLEDTNIYVSWYMNNADDYIDSVTYTVYCLDDKGKEVQTRSSVGLNTNVLFEGLKPNTNYNFKVAAFNAANESEESEVVDSATAHRLKPDAVEGLVVEQGLGVNSIKLHIPLPNFVDVTVGKKLYEPRPLYFKIYRREFLEGDNQEEFKFIKRFGDEVKTGDKIDYSKIDFGDGNTKEYIPGEFVIFTDSDSDLKPNVIYEYKIQSFASDEREISSDESVAYNKGWLVPNFSFTTQLEYKIEKLQNPDKKEEFVNTKTEASITFCLSMKNYGVPYKFKITQIKEDLEHKNTVTNDILEIDSKDFTTSQDDVVIKNHLIATMDLKKNKNEVCGYYQYKVTVLGEDGSKLTEYLNPKQELVTDSMDVPDIGQIVITTGYSDKITIGWNWNLSCEYSLVIEDTDSHQTVEKSYSDLQKYMEDQLITVEKSPTKQVPVVYTDTDVLPGSKRKYILNMKLTGNYEHQLTKSSQSIEASVPLNPVINPKFSYDKIIVNIENIKREDSKVIPSFINKNENTNRYRLEEVENGISGSYEYNIVPTTPIEGNGKDRIFEDGILGEPVNIKVIEQRKLTSRTYNENGFISENELSNKETITVSKDTATVGPALLDINVSKRESADTISVSWNKTLGANGYLIFRDRYYLGPEALKSDLVLKTETAELYKVIITSDGNIKVSSDNIGTLGKMENVDDYVKITFSEKENRYTLQDIYRPLGDATTEDDGYYWKKGQSEITWGAPYKYTIIPIISENDIDSFSKNKDDIVTVSINSENKFNIVNTTDSMKRMGGTIGYGWNVKASKGNYCEDGATDSLNQYLNNSIKITWSTPFFANPKNYIDPNTITTPSFQIFRKKLAEINGWEMLEIPINGYACVDKKAEQGIVYEYAIVDVNYDENNGLSPNLDFQELQKNNKPVSSNQLPDVSGFTLPNPKIISASREDKGVDSEEITFNPIKINNNKNYGISGYAIEVKNNNIDNNWHTIKTLAFKGNELVVEGTDTVVGTGDGQYKIMVNNDLVDSSNPNSERLLKVLRDYKHYFRIRAYVNVFSENEGKTVKLFNMLNEKPEDFDTNLKEGYVRWGCRQITTDEFVRSANLLVTYGVHLYWKEHGSSPNLIFKDGSDLNVFNVDTDVFIFNGYQRAIPTKSPKTEAAFLKANGTFNAKYYGTNNPYGFVAEKISFSCEDSSVTTLYNGSIKYEENGFMYVTYNKVTKEYRYNDSEGKYCPMVIGYNSWDTSNKREYLHESEEWK